MRGLTDKQVEESQIKYGFNILSEVQTESFWSKFKTNFSDPMIKILCVALAINVVFAFLGQVEWYESFGIMIAVLLATFVSTFSEYKNENAFQKLQEEASKIKCKVYRNHTLTEIKIDNVVVGDVIVLQTGDKIPADGFIIEGEIKVDQSVLNGESESSRKTKAYDDFKMTADSIDFLNQHQVFRGSVVRSGNALMQVAIVGDSSAYGQIASGLQDDEDRDSPLKVKLTDLANSISKFGYIGGVAIAFAFLFKQIVIQNSFNLSNILNYCSNFMVLINDVVRAVILAVIIIVVAVPEGLPLMIAIVSALNMGKMLKDNVLVRKISGIETAGSLNILFSDKTGTITKGQLEAVIFVDAQGNEYLDYQCMPKELSDLLSLSVANNTSSIVSVEDDQIKILGGNATERAILGFVSKNIKSFDISQKHSIPFDSANKYSATQIEGEYNKILLKGAPEKIISKCKSYYNDDGEVCDFTDTSLIEQQIDNLAKRAIRVLAFATADGHLTENTLEQGNFTLVGIIGIRDEVRPESIVAIKEVQQAGVQVVMITGDREDTAVAIAKEAGLFNKSEDIVLSSSKLQELSDEKLKSMLPNIRVIARALPSDKSRLVRIAQEMDLVVGMTGDGVNDSPALKLADVGFAMGGGTEVAKESSDIVILDDNFNSIGRAILYGRTIFNSIRKFIIFQLTINVSAVVVSFASPLLGMENPLSITQFLWINLVMDTLAALAFGGEPALSKFMQEKPKRRDERIVNSYMWSSILTGSGYVFIISMVYLLTNVIRNIFREDITDKYLLTGYFTFFILVSVVNAFNARTEKLNIFDNFTLNKGFIRVMGIIVIVQISMTYLGNVILRCYGLNVAEWIVVIVLSLLIVPVDLIRKLLYSRLVKE